MTSSTHCYNCKSLTLKGREFVCCKFDKVVGIYQDENMERIHPKRIKEDCFVPAKPRVEQKEPI